MQTYQLRVDQFLENTKESLLEYCNAQSLYCYIVNIEVLVDYFSDMHIFHDQIFTDQYV